VNEHELDSVVADQDATNLVQRRPDPPVGDREHGVLFVLSGPRAGTIYPLDEPVVNLGRGPTCQIPLQDEGVSRLHARIRRTVTGFVLEDAGSRNGTFCQGIRLSGPKQLEEGDRINMGATTGFRFSLQDRTEFHAIRHTLELMNHDALTDLLNRRELLERFEAELAYARRHDTPLSVLLIDIDHFKRINDEFGHLIGDVVLRETANALTRTLRAEDVFGRYGGDEFALAVRAVDRPGVLALAERMRACIEETISGSSKRGMRITISVGGVMLTAQHADVETLIDDADKALYEAKELGRNRVVMR
jgi:two-component system, cell cycle response regulator